MISHLPEEVRKGRLNPDWVEWLMGWPIGWTDLERDDIDEHPGWHHDPADDGSVPRVTERKDLRRKRLKALGNGIVPQCAAVGWKL